MNSLFLSNPNQNQGDRKIRKKDEEIIVFAPHPDDEALGCGGTIAKKVDEGYEVFVVFMTDGRNHFVKAYGITSNPTPNEYRVIRRNEAKRAAKKLGVHDGNLFFLDYEDGKLNGSEEEAQKTVVELLDEISPTEIYFPRKEDLHIDHRTTNRIVQNSLRNLGFHPVGYQYSIWPEFGRLSPIADKIVSLLGHRIVCIDISDFVCLKRQAIYEYKSQVTILSPEQKRPTFDGASLKRFLRNKESFFVKGS